MGEAGGARPQCRQPNVNLERKEGPGPGTKEYGVMMQRRRDEWWDSKDSAMRLHWC